MLIIGLHNDEDSGACLFKDGKLIDAVNEERLNRIKLFKGVPELSLSYLLKKHGIDVGDVDYFAYGWHGRQNDYRGYARKLAARIIEALGDNPKCGDIIQERLDVEITRDAETRDEFEAWMAKLGVARERVAFLDHHQSHAWSAYACSPFERALVVTMDGRGDLKSQSVSVASPEGIRELDYALSFDSLGFLYGQITHHLGFVPHRHEGKVTGLAAHGDPERTLPLFRSLIEWRNGRIVSRMGPYRPFYTNIHPDLSRALSQFSKEDLAAGVQRHCEELCVAYVTWWLDKLKHENLRHVCLAGGIFANVRINQHIAEIPGVDNVYIFPHMGDGGLSVGAGAQLLHKLTGQSKVDMPSVLLGTDYGDDEIDKAIAAFSGLIDVRRPQDVVGETVQALEASKVVGWFEGRMEFGPRALGARSILHHARDKASNDWLNKRLHRTEFMPFAPVTPVEFADQCYVGWKRADVSAHFMTRTYDCTPTFVARHGAVVHIDGTARPQIVSEERNAGYYKVTRAYCDRSGDMALINTSFNQHEEPIVCSPENALGSLVNDNVDLLAIGDRLVTRK